MTPGAAAQSASPQPSASTYLGGSANDAAWVVDVGPDGDVFVAGATTSSDFPGSTGTPRRHDVFVARLSPDAKQIRWAKTLGGSDVEQPTGLRVATDGVYVAGETGSSDFPMVGAYDSSHGGGTDGFLAKFGFNGAHLWSTYFGGTAYDSIQDLDLAPDGKPVIGGTTLSCDFPSWDGAYRKPPTGCSFHAGDAFVARFWPDGALNRVTLFGGSSSDRLFGISVGAQSGSVLITGQTTSTDLPFSANAYRTRPEELYVAKLSDGLDTLSWATYLGGEASSDWAWDVSRDSAGNAYVVGYTYSTDFPTTLGAYRTTHQSPTGCPSGPSTFDAPCRDAFVTKLDSSGSKLVYSTFLGGDLDDDGYGITVDGQGVAYVAGETQSGDSFLPSRAGSRGFADAFLAAVEPDGSALRLLAGVGGSEWDSGRHVTIGGGQAWISGFTWSSDFPTTDGAADRTFAGGDEGFLTAFAVDLPRPSLVFDHRGGNEWWVEMTVAGAPVAAVEARDEGGAWVPLRKQWWGEWAASFHIEPGHDVQFRAMTGGQWVESCKFTHPDGIEQCGEDFAATFFNAKGNEWWIEVSVQANEPLSGVDVMLNGGAARPLSRMSWGSWAASYLAPTGTVVQFVAKSSSGDRAVSGCYEWPSADPVSCETAAPIFDHRGGNEWWVESLVIGAKPTRVLARDTDGPWTDLTLRDWGNWAGSFRVEPGHQVQFLAEVDGTWYQSCWFSHPAGVASTGNSTCTGAAQA